jgi:hypothetical protein
MVWPEDAIMMFDRIADIRGEVRGVIARAGGGFYLFALPREGGRL